MKDILTTASAAEILGVSVRTAQLWVESGQLPSWKTPGGHRRIPRQAVLDLVEENSTEHVSMAARAVVVAASGRANDWRLVGLPGSGLLLDVVEDAEAAFRLFAATPPMLIIVENADDDDRKKLIASVGSNFRFRQTGLFSVVEKGPERPVARAHHRVQFKMSGNVLELSSTIMDYLRSTLPSTPRSAGFLPPWNESARLEAVQQSDLLGSAPDASFDRLVRLAAHAAHAPVAMFTLITRDTQWFKSRIGFDGETTPRDWSFCNQTLLANEFTVIEDLSKVENFDQNPALAEPFGFRFYAGAPVRDPQDFALGSICVIDVVPRKLDNSELEALSTIAEATSNLIRVRIQQREERNKLATGM